jgi:hypothetical protein
MLNTSSSPAKTFPSLPRIAGAGVVFWALLSSIGLQFFAFRTHISQDIEHGYPFAYDQGVYLGQAYEAYSDMRANGLGRGLYNVSFGEGRPQGVMLQTQAAVAYLAFGATRTTSLMISFLYFAILQVALYLAVSQLSGERSWGLCAVGLLLLTSSRYFWAGGLDDFRIDSAASSIYGISLCLLLLSRMGRLPGWTLGFGASLGLLFSFRFIAMSYGLIALGLLWLYLYIVERAATVKSEIISQRRQVTLAGILSVILVGPFLLHQMKGLYGYYIGGHLLGPEKAFRASQAGVTNFVTAIRYYPASLATSHLGAPFCEVVALLLGLAVIWRLAGRAAVENTPLSLNPTRTDWRGATVSSLLWLVCPLILFMMDESKSPVVACMLVCPSVVLVTLALNRLAGDKVLSLRWPGITRAGYVFFFVTFLAGNLHVLAAGAKRPPYLETLAGARDLGDAFDEITKRALASRKGTVIFATDRILDYFNGTMARVMIFERSGELLKTQELLATGPLTEHSEQEALDALRQADFALVTVSEDPTEYPFDHAMRPYQAKMTAWAKENLVRIRSVQMPGHRFNIYSRQASPVVLRGDTGGWLESRGTALDVPTESLRQKRVVVLEGNSIFAEQLRDGLRCHAWLGDSEASGVPIYARCVLTGANYRIDLDTSAAVLPDDEDTTLGLVFDTYFIPKERGINADPRSLAVLKPSHMYLTSKVAPNPLSAK